MTKTTTHRAPLFLFLQLRTVLVFYHLTGSVPTEELKSIKRQVFSPGSKKGTGSLEPDTLSLDRSPHSLVLDEHDEMQMSDAAAAPTEEDCFEDEPIKNEKTNLDATSGLDYQ